MKECPEGLKINEDQKKCLESYNDNQFEYNNICYDDCPNNTYKIFQNRNICSIEIPENYYLDDDNVYKECYNKCKKCSASGNEAINNCDECINNYTFLNESFVPNKNCFLKCEYQYYFDSSMQYICNELNLCSIPYNKFVEGKNKCIDECINDDEYIYEYNNKCLKECPEGLKINEEQKKCLESCNDNQFEYNNICYDDCPSGTHKIFQNRNICIVNVPENYYLDEDNINKECYNTCKKCSQSGNDTNNNCDECINNYIFLNESSVPSKNCYRECIYFFYFNETDQYVCTESNICPSPYNILIEEKKKCIDECKKD